MGTISIRLHTILLLIFLISSDLTRVSAQNEELESIYRRRIDDIIKATHNPDLANRWRTELTPQGIWTDVDYTAGCPARRANWPAQDHFHRINTMASAFHLEPSDADLLSKISLALNYWFDNDFTSVDCINAGGQDRLTCPCGTPGLWNTNWYCQMILMPGLVGSACLLLRSNLTQTQFDKCSEQTYRSYVRIDGDPNGSMGAMTGANMIDVASIGVSNALLSSDGILMNNALERYYNESQLTTGGADGIKVDGSFMQHSTQIYNGNYGAVFMRNLLKIFIQTADTTLGPPLSAQSAFLTVINGSEWFIYSKNDPNDPSPRLSWQYSVIGRMVSHKYEDWRGIGLDLNELLEGTKTWSNHASFQEIVARLRNQSGVNPGPLVGTKYFHASDFLVHRGGKYTVALKMFSSRTTNSECNNNQNPFGFHLSDGTIYTQLTGNEYTNVYGAWDWNLIPGTTVDYGASQLTCGRVQFKGRESFVGGIALGHAGIAVMNYTNPMTQSLHWCKTYFFFPNSYAVQFVGKALSSDPSAPVLTTLDQRQRSGPIYLDGQIITDEKVQQVGQSLWHDRVGYRFINPIELNIDTAPRQSNWSAIGISIGNETQSLFGAYFAHPADEDRDDRYTYIASLDISQQDFQGIGQKGQPNVVEIIQNDPNVKSTTAPAIVRGAFYGDAGGIIGDRIISLAFLTSGEYETGLEDIRRVDTDAPVLLLFQRKDNGAGWRVAVADPTQSLRTVQIHVTTTGVPIELNVQLPEGAWAGGSSVEEF